MWWKPFLFTFRWDKNKYQMQPFSPLLLGLRCVSAACSAALSQQWPSPTGCHHLPTRASRCTFGKVDEEWWEHGTLWLRHFKMKHPQTDGWEAQAGRMWPWRGCGRFPLKAQASTVPQRLPLSCASSWPGVLALLGHFYNRPHPHTWQVQETASTDAF